MKHLVNFLKDAAATWWSNGPWWWRKGFFVPLYERDVATTYVALDRKKTWCFISAPVSHKPNTNTWSSFVVCTPEPILPVWRAGCACWLSLLHFRRFYILKWLLHFLSTLWPQRLKYYSMAQIVLLLSLDLSPFVPYVFLFYFFLSPCLSPFLSLLTLLPYFAFFLSLHFLPHFAHPFHPSIPLSPLCLISLPPFFVF